MQLQWIDPQRRAETERLGAAAAKEAHARCRARQARDGEAAAIPCRVGYPAAQETVLRGVALARTVGKRL